MSTAQGTGIPTGKYRIGPEQGQLRLGTGTDGPMAAMGHHLALQCERWEAVITIADSLDDCRLDVTVDLTQLSVIEGHGGPQPLTDKGRRDILRNTARSLESEQYPTLRFVVTGYQGRWDDGRVSGRMSVHGQTRQESFAVRIVDGDFRLSGSVTQTHYQIKPHSAMMGALRVADEVTIEARVPAAVLTEPSA